MGKHEPMTAKAIAIKIKSKGLQKIKFYCEMCKKQCRDDNGFKCHIASESHQRQALIVSEDPEKFVKGFSKEFTDGFMHILKARYRSTRILANTVFQEYIKDKQHVHLNSTRWLSLTDFANWLGKNGTVKVDQTEKGVWITYIDNDPETIRRRELEEKRAQQAKEEALRTQREIDRQREASKKLLENLDSKKERLPIEPIPMIKTTVKDEVNDQAELDPQCPSSAQTPNLPDSSSVDTETSERPLFKLPAISLKTSCPSSYKPQPPKRKVSTKKIVQKKFKPS